VYRAALWNVSCSAIQHDMSVRLCNKHSLSLYRCTVTVTGDLRTSVTRDLRGGHGCDARTRTRTYMCLHIRLHMRCTHTHIHLLTHTLAHTHTHSHMHTHTLAHIHTCTRAHMHIYMHPLSLSLSLTNKSTRHISSHSLKVNRCSVSSVFFWGLDLLLDSHLIAIDS